ncbi:MAG: hypothetical protein RJA36_129 [Pseudomonadota bacterium]|jgi:hypothetical protein
MSFMVGSLVTGKYRLSEGPAKGTQVGLFVVRAWDGLKM